MKQPIINNIGFDTTTETVKFSIALGNERFDYSAGIGCVPAKNKAKLQAEIEKLDRQGGMPNKGRVLRMFQLINQGRMKASANLKDATVQEIFRIIGRNVEVSADDFFYSILSDARAGELSHRDFCAEFGYDSDSIKAQDIWHACRASGRKLRDELTTAEIEELETRLQDY